MASRTFRMLKILPGFLLGVASVFDLGATLNIYNDTPVEITDYKAIQSDWEATGDDLRHALTKYGE